MASLEFFQLDLMLAFADKVPFPLLKLLGGEASGKEKACQAVLNFKSLLPQAHN